MTRESIGNCIVINTEVEFANVCGTSTEEQDISSSMGHLVGLGRGYLRSDEMDGEMAARIPVAACPVPACRAITAHPRGMPPGPKTWSWLAVAPMFSST